MPEEIVKVEPEILDPEEDEEEEFDLYQALRPPPIGYFNMGGGNYSNKYGS